MKMAIAALTLMAVSGCSIKQSVTPAAIEAASTTEICMIPAKGLRAGFHNTYRDLLIGKGFTVKQLAPGASRLVCGLSTEYVGNWAWDLALYMVYADIKVYQNGRQVGQATYDAKWGGGRLDKFISAKEKITELTDQLFPVGAVAMEAALTPAQVSGSQPLSKSAYQAQQLQHLMRQNLSYEQYQERHRAIMAE